MKKLKKTRKTLVAGIFFLIIGFTILFSLLFREKIYSNYDLIEIRARLHNYSFTEYGDYLNRVYSYHLFLEEFDNDFIMLSDFVRYFDISLFEQSVKSGDSIIIDIYQKDFKSLNIKKKIRIYSLSDNKRTYLNLNSTLKEYNSPQYNFFAAAFIISGIIALFIYFDK